MIFLPNRKSDMISNSEASFQFLVHSNIFNILYKSDDCDCHFRITAIKLCNTRRSYALIVKDEHLGWLSLFD